MTGNSTNGQTRQHCAHRMHKGKENIDREEANLPKYKIGAKSNPAASGWEAEEWNNQRQENDLQRKTAQ